MILHFLQVFFRFLSTPSARRATKSSANLPYKAVFLSTPSARRATNTCLRGRPHRTNFYPHPPRGGRLIPVRLAVPVRNFYPHPPRGGRPRQAVADAESAPFLSTPSARRATETLQVPGIKANLFLSTPSARRATSKTVILTWRW